MCGGTLAIEKPGGGQSERPRADTCYAARVKRHRGDRAGISRRADIQHLDADDEKRIPSLSGGSEVMETPQLALTDAPVSETTTAV